MARGALGGPGRVARGLGEELSADEVDDLVRRGLAREAGGLAVAASPLLRAMAETSMPSARVRRLTRRVGPFWVGGSRISATSSVPSTARRKSMMPSAKGSSAPAASKSVRSRSETITRPLDHPRLGERPGEQLDLGERDVLVDVLEHAVDVRARLDELGGEA